MTRPRVATPRRIEERAEQTLERRLKVLTEILAPTTVFAALLFYFGYVATTAEFGYYGVTLGTLRLSYQDVVLRSVAALYVPLAVLVALGLGGAWLHATVRRLAVSGEHRGVLRYAGLVVCLAGIALTVRGIVGVVVPDVARTEPVATTPGSLGLGVTAIAYGMFLRQAGATQTAWRPPIWLRVATNGSVIALVVLSAFWVTNSFAAAYGRGQAIAGAQRLDQLPAVVLDTTEPLYADYAGMTSTALPATEGQVYRYRYRGLRLLAESGERMFLIPDGWEVRSGAVLVIPADASSRVQLYQSVG